jgi:hypothetical protein
MKSFPKEIEDFATTFVTMQDMRHDADYDPMASFSKSQAEVAGRLVTGAIESFRKVPVQHRRAFCAYVLLRKRTGWAGGKQGWGHMETGRRGGGEKKEARVLLRLLLPAFPSPCESSRLSPPRDRGSTADFRSLTWTGDRTEYFR